MRSNRVSRYVIGAWVLAVFGCGVCCAADPYTLDFLPNHHAKVVLATGADAFTDAFPMASRGPSPLAALDLSNATSESGPVHDALGNGTRFTFETKQWAWHVTTYSGKPFLTAQAIYKNTGDAPETVRMLVPWASKGCSLGPGTNRAPILDNGGLTDPKAKLRGPEDRDVLSMWNLGVYNPAGNRSLIAGFLTNARSYPQIHIARAKELDVDAFDLFQAECHYDAPIEVAPGASLASEIVYISVADDDPLTGLENFAASVSAWNDLHPTRTALPHGWDSWVSQYHSRITEKEMVAELDFEDVNLKRYGWTHFSIDDGWQRTAGDWEADPERFPKGMKAFADNVHARGMTAGLWTEPFTINLDTPVAREHPEWLAKPGLLGMSMVGGNERILDVTQPGAYEFVRDVYRKICGEWGYDALVETDFVYHELLADSYADESATHPQAMRTGLEAIRDGAGPNTFIMGVAPFAVTGFIADGMRTGIDCAPVWRKAADMWSWGCVDTLTNAAKRYYFAPRVFALDQDCAFFGHESTRKRWKVENLPALTWEQQVAWMTGAALTGGAVKIGDAFTELTPEEVGVLRRLLPVMTQPARPIDLFEREEARVWVLPIDCAIGQWHIVGVFNWNESEEATISVSFDRMGLTPGVDYAVFDFWPGVYCGLAKNALDVTVPPGSVRLLSIRPYENHPMFLATDRHFTQGATDFTALAWNAESRTLSGAFDGIENTDYAMWVLVPEGYEAKKTTVSTGPAHVEPTGEVRKIAFHCVAAGPVNWQMDF